MYEGQKILDILQTPWESLWGSVSVFIPRLLAALIVFLIGWIIAVLLGKAAWHIVRIIQLDRGLESVGFKRLWERTGYRLNTPRLFYELVKWFFIVLFLMISTNILGLTQVTAFLITVVEYIPNIFLALLVLVIGVFVARFLEGVVRGSARAAEIGSSNALAAVVRWTVMIFSILIALEQLQVATDVIKIAVTGIVVAASLALGLAFGLGGRSHAEEYLSRMKKHMSE